MQASENLVWGFKSQALVSQWHFTFSLLLLSFFVRSEGSPFLPSRPAIRKTDAVARRGCQGWPSRLPRSFRTTAASRPHLQTAPSTRRLVRSGLRKVWFIMSQRLLICARISACWSGRQFRRGARCRTRKLAPQPCIRWVLRPDHDAVMRISGGLRGGGPILHNGIKAVGFGGTPPPRNRHRRSVARRADRAELYELIARRGSRLFKPGA